MSDDSWSSRRSPNDEDFGPPLFGDDPTGEIGVEDLSFGDGGTGPLPHWSDPPTGEIPRSVGDASGSFERPPTGEDVDVWSSFSGKSPVWSDDSPADDITGAYDLTAPSGSALPPTGVDSDDFDVPPIEPPVRREPSRITIGTDPTGDGARVPPRRPRPGDNRGGQRPPRTPAGRPAQPQGGTGGRDMGAAVGAGLLLAAGFIAAIRFAPIEVVLGIVVLVLGLASVEFFNTVGEKGYAPANIVGIFGCVAAPLVAYWFGDTQGALLMVVVLAFIASCLTVMQGPDLERAPLPNVAVTMLGVLWIGVLGSFGALILTFSKSSVGLAGDNIGTDTLFLVALGVVANDVGAFFVGSALGNRPLRAWISPNKSVEGLIGGSAATILAMIAANVVGSDSWNSLGDLLLLGVVVAVFAPLGDLTESMFKRNLGVKDFGSMIRGHGGVLDRFDGFLFVLPAAWYLLITLQPWLTK
jgi:phosphatidate cytidylyltransferase